MPRLTKVFMIMGLCSLLAVSARASELVDRVVAVVNGKLITLFDVNARVADVMQRTQGVTFKPDDPRNAELQRQVLNSLINDILIEQEAARLQIKVSETELDSQIDELRKKGNLTKEQFNLALMKEGLNLKQFRQKLREDAMKKRLLGYMVHRKALVTENDIRDYYEKHKDELSSKWSVLGPRVAGNISFIMVPTKKQAETLRSKIASGAISFANAAKQYSIGPGKDQGGNLGDVQVKDLAPPLRAALGAAKPGQVTEPVMLDGKAVLLVWQDKSKKAPAPAAPAAAQAGPTLESVHDQIQELLYRQKVDKLFQEYIDNLRSKAVVDVRL